jgi:spermidine/putrescine transport system permease protein
VLILIPMWMNFLLRTYAMMSLMEDSGIINQFLKRLGLTPRFDDRHRRGVLTGMVYNFVPFMILPVYTALKKMDERILEAAEDLGANPP